MRGAKKLLGVVAGPWVRRLTRGSCRVLMYHRFGGTADCRRLRIEVFERQMAYVKKNFRPLPLAELAQRLTNGDALPQNSVVVTLDDGYADFCRIAVPILTRYQIPATIFVVSDFVDRRIWLWYDALRYLVDAATGDDLSLTVAGRRQRLHLVDRASRDLVWERLADDLLPLPMSAKWQRICELAGDLGVARPELPTSEYEAASWKELRGLDFRLFDVGSHTKSHAILPHCDPQELRIELEESKKVIEERLERDVRCFCYPNGQKADYDEATVRAVRAAGYECAVVAHGGLVDAHADPYRIERLSPASALSTFRNELNGIPDLRRRLAARLRI